MRIPKEIEFIKANIAGGSGVLLPSGGSGRGRRLGGESVRPVRGFGTGTTGGGGLLYLSMEKQRVLGGEERGM